MMFLALHPMDFIFLNSSDSLENLVAASSHVADFNTRSVNSETSQTRLSVSYIYLSLSTGTIACDHYARECEFGILDKKNLSAVFLTK